jgi:hypothetical protein
MKYAKHHELRQIRRWVIAFFVVLLVGTCSVAYAFSGDQLPKNSDTPMIMALAASFRVK